MVWVSRLFTGREGLAMGSTNGRTNDNRDAEDDTLMRARAADARRRAEAGLLRDDTEYLLRRLAEERQRLVRR
jgi:hypothetical protein